MTHPGNYAVCIIGLGAMGMGAARSCLRAGLTTYGADLNPQVLVTLATCFGGLGLSHVNDSGFWIVTRYLGLSVADGLKTWTVLTTLLGLSGFLFTWLLWLAV